MRHWGPQRVVLLAWLGAASACVSVSSLDFDLCIDVPRAAAAGDERFVPRVQDLPRVPPAGQDADRVTCWKFGDVDCLFHVSPSEPGIVSFLCRVDSRAAAQAALGHVRESYRYSKDPLLPPEPGLALAVVDRESEDAASWGADAVVGEKRVGSVRVERKGRHLLLFECRGLWMPPEELESFLAPFLARMQEWQPRQREAS